MDAALQPLRHALTGNALCLQDQSALADGLSYEQRIFQQGGIATRSGNWHDLFNALAWKAFPVLKSTLNALQVADGARAGSTQRTRRQEALTQFDEAGAVVVLRDASLLALWDRHDWQALFLEHASAWQDGRIQVHVFGHALYEHALLPDMLLVSKTLVLHDAAGKLRPGDVDAATARFISSPQGLADPQELRPLPLSGMPGWHRERQDEAFYRGKPCFRALRPGRIYPAPFAVQRGPALTAM